MLRRSSEKPLTLYQIADDWSREIQPARSLDELLNELVPAWWRGELHAVSGPTRLKLLKALFKTSRTEVPFWVKGEAPPPKLHGISRTVELKYSWFPSYLSQAMSQKLGLMKNVQRRMRWLLNIGAIVISVLLPRR